MSGSSVIKTDVSVNAFNRLACQKPKKKRLPPLSIRLNEKQYAKLKRLAGNQNLGTYVKTVLFGKDAKPRKSRQHQPIKDYQILALALDQLAQLNALNTFHTLLEMDDLSPEAEQEIRQACADVHAMRRNLITALGVKAENTG